MSYVDPDVRAFLDSLDPNARDFANLTPAEVRAGSELVVDQMLPAVEVSAVQDVEIPTRAGTIGARLYRPTSDLPLFVFFHGGGWEFGSVEISDRPMRRLANSSGCAVLSVDYRLAPEHPFPAPLDDCVDATTWAAEHVEELGVGTGFLGVGGDSAGGNLAAAVAQYVRDHGGPRIDHQLLVYPVVTRDFDTASYLAYADGYFLTRDNMRHFWELYAGSGTPRYADLLNTDTLAGLPAATVITCGLDPLSSEGRRYAERLVDAGVATTYTEVAGVIHAIWYRDAIGPAAYAFGELVAASLRTAALTRMRQGSDGQ